MIRLSVVIITFNEEKNIARCIDSVREVADEILVVDSFSTDQTKDICKEKGVRFIQNKFEGHIQQKNYAIDQSSFDHILSLDADEYLSPVLAKSILEVKNNWKSEAYEMNRLSSYGGRWMKLSAWYPDRKVRLWNKQYGRWGGDNPHDKVILAKHTTVTKLKGDLMHVAYENASDFLKKVQAYSDIFAREKRFTLRSNSFKIFYKTVYTFFFNFFLKLGIAGGYEGAIISMSNTNYTFYKYAKLREANQQLGISLIITTYNRKDALALVLQSVLQQVVLPNEILIADDGSTEDTKQMIERLSQTFPIPIIHCWHEDIGFRVGAIRNKAIARAKNEYIIMIDGDIVVHPFFIFDHKRFAWKGRFLQGSRVLLQESTTKMAIDQMRVNVNFLSSGIDNRINTLRSKYLSTVLSYYRGGHMHVRAANISCWRDDLLKVNGFNEDFVGWGREDSELAVRLQNLGLKRLHVKFGAFGYHLHHPQSSRTRLEMNDGLLDTTLRNKITWCTNGIFKNSE